MTDSRTSGAQPIASDAEMRGRTLDTDYTVKPGQQFYRNPGATPNLRGVEPNTNEDKGSSQGDVPSTGETPQPGQIGDEAGPSGDPGDDFAGSGSTGTRVQGRQGENSTPNPDQHTNSTHAYEVPT